MPGKESKGKERPAMLYMGHDARGETGRCEQGEADEREVHGEQRDRELGDGTSTMEGGGLEGQRHGIRDEGQSKTRTDMIRRGKTE